MAAFDPLRTLAVSATFSVMGLNRRALGGLASWLLFGAALALASVLSLELMVAEAIWGTSQLNSHPLLYGLVVLLVLSPLISAAAGLIRTSAKRRTAVASALLCFLALYGLFVFGLLP